ncbi:MAG: glycosyltransferase [Ignavibacteria bacterium]|nr:glycosyltransferase [Ignavibacteria bacterium]
MIYEIFQVLLWITAIMLFISGIDDLYLDLLYWLQRRKYKKKLPDFSEMFDKEEKPIAIFLGAWRESSVIGRTLSYATRNLNYSNYRFFVGVYPNDPETIRVVQEISRKDPRIIPVVNSLDGPTTKADNLNNLYAAVLEYEKKFGQFEIILVHDAEDFIHPNSLRLYNFLLGYKGYHAVQIPVIPIKSKFGKLFHRTYCDAFAEVHTKDMIVRQAMGTFIPFAGTGMGFHRKTFNYLEKYNFDLEIAKMHKDEIDDPFDTGFKEDVKKEEVKKDETKFSEEDFAFNNDESHRNGIYINDTKYHDDPFNSLNVDYLEGGKKVPDSVKGYTFLFVSMVMGWVAFLIYSGNTDASQHILTNSDFVERISLSPGDVEARNNEYGSLEKMIKEEINNTNEIKDGIIMLSNGFTDEKYAVLYIKTEKGLEIQESTWTTEMAARNRVEGLKSTGLFSNKDFDIQSVNNSGTVMFRVIISTYDNIDDAREDIMRIKEPVN